MSVNKDCSKRGAAMELLTKADYAFSTHCMSCDNGKNYRIDDDIPESCPVCGEHKEYTILNVNSHTSITEQG